VYAGKRGSQTRGGERDADGELPDFLVFPAGRIVDWPGQKTASGEKVPMTSEKVPMISSLEIGNRRNVIE
jgi:hypothetical protein